MGGRGLAAGHDRCQAGAAPIRAEARMGRILLLALEACDAVAISPGASSSRSTILAHLGLSAEVPQPDPP